jgi:hypothetical protein
MSETRQKDPSPETPDAGAWTRALLTLDLALESCRAAAGAQSDGAPRPPPLGRIAPPGAPPSLWRACVSLGMADLWQRMGLRGRAR